MNKTSDTQSGGRGWFKKLFWLVVLAGCGLGLVAAGVRWHGPLGRLVGLAGRQERGPTTRPAPADQQVWYTCGMHPSVLQKQPGNCPICGMKLTPLRAGAAGVAPSGPKQRKILYWRAPMDPNYISDKPGKSPMGMELVPVYAEPGEEISAAAIRIDPVTVQNMGIRTVRLKRDRLVKVIRTVGRLDYDERKVGDVTTRFDGWIEKLYVDYLGMQVHQGDPLFEIYSPEVYETADTYLKSLASGILAADTRRRLELLGVPGREIERLESQHQLRRTILVRSPFSGIVVEKMVQAGSYVKSGMRLYRIADLSTIWVYVDIYEYQLPWVRLGQEATMTLPYIPGRTFRGKVLYIYPYLTRAARVVKVRLEFDNPKQELKPGMYANVRLEAVVKDDALLIPREAYIDSGLRKVAFVDLGDGRFEPRQIRTGMESDGLVEVLDGLYEGEAVVSSGQFLLDAESKLREAVAKMTRLGAAATSSPSPSQRSGHAKPTGQEHASPTTQPAEASAGVAYTCPDHINVFSSAPGQCPRCGRQLEPFKLIYTCRRMEHAAVLSSSKGRCPRCGQELVPMRGPWLSDAMAWANTPPTTQAAARAAYHCPVHPLVHSELPGRCTICARPLERGPAATQPAATQPAAPRQYVCPMHPQVRRAGPGSCPICAMRLVRADRLRPAESPSAAARRQVDFLLEHYLAMQRLLASDRLKDVARHGLGLAAASTELVRLAEAGNAGMSAKGLSAVKAVRSAAVRVRGQDLDEDRAVFVDISRSVLALLEHVRPDRSQWPRLYIFHCPMANADWLQASRSIANPYYGSKMLRCGQLRGRR